MSFTISTLYGPMMRPVKVYVLALLSLSLLSCSQTSPKLSTRFLVSSKTVTSPDGQAPPMPPELVPQSGSLSQATTTDIADFGMYIREIKVCQSINILGESFSVPQGCIIIRKRRDSSGDWVRDQFQIQSWQNWWRRAPQHSHEPARFAPKCQWPSDAE